MSNNQQNQNPEQQSLNNAKKASRPAVRKGAKAAAKLGAKAGKLLLKVLAEAVKIILPYVFIIMGVLFIAWLFYNMIFEWKGTEKEYYPREENPLVLEETNEGYIYRAEEGEITERNKIIRDFYDYYGGTSVWKIEGSDFSDVMERDSDEYAETVDHYKREELYTLNDNMLLALDDFLFDSLDELFAEGIDEEYLYDSFKVPEQFIRPVLYDPETLKLKPLVGPGGNVIVESEEIDLETGNKTGEKILSVRDYGLASTLIYNIENEYTTTHKIIGRYAKEERWDGENVYKVDIDIPIEGIVMHGYPKEIDLIDKAITFDGVEHFTYEYQDIPLRQLTSGSTTDEREPYVAVQYDRYVAGQDCKDVPVINEITQEETMEEVCTPIYKPLYRYRSKDTLVYEYAPIEIGVDKDTEVSNYFNSYVENFEAYVHVDTVTDEEIFNRIDYDSFVFDDKANFSSNEFIQVGIKSNSDEIEQASTFWDTIKKYSDEFDVDPRLILAMIAQESSGDPSKKGGLAQITYSEKEPTKKADAYNKDGEHIFIEVKPGEEKNTDTAIRYMAIRYAGLLNHYDDTLKALQAYNFGEGTMLKVKAANNEAWDNEYEWLNYREQGRLKQFPSTISASYDCMPGHDYNSQLDKAGDTCYVDHVMQFYPGDDIEIKKTLGSKVTGFFSAIFDDLFPPQDELIKSGVHVEYIPLIHETIPDDIRGVTKAMNEEILFNDIGTGGPAHFYDQGLGSAGSQYSSYDDIVDMTPGSKGFIWPVPSDIRRISSTYKLRFHPIWKEWRWHTGVDIPLPTGRAIYAVADGTITVSQFLKGYGNSVYIDHGNGLVTRYAHNSALLVNVGDIVTQGQIIARAGSTGDSTGPHLHFEIRVNGQHTNPMPWLQQ